MHGDGDGAPLLAWVTCLPSLSRACFHQYYGCSSCTDRSWCGACSTTAPAYKLLPKIKHLFKGSFFSKRFMKIYIFPIFHHFFLQIFDGACDWLKVEIWIQIQPITSSVKNLEEKLMKNQRKVYFHKPFQEKATFKSVHSTGIEKLH